MEDDDEVCLLLPPRSWHLRAARLVAAEAGTQAGLDPAEVVDLCLAVDELCYTLMDISDQRLLLRVLVRDGRVIVRGTARHRRGAAPPRLASIAERLVRTVADHHEVALDGDHMSFVVMKQATMVRR